MAMLLAAKTYSINNVHETCVNQIVRHFEEVSGSEKFNELGIDALLRLLQDDRLGATDENTVFKVALSWLRHSESNLAHTGDVIKACRLGLVGTRILQEGLEVTFLSRDMEGLKILNQAMIREAWSLDSMLKERPAMFRKRKNKAFYDSLREIFSVGDAAGVGRLKAPYAACVLGHLVLVADKGSGRLVAFSRPEPAVKPSYVCYVDIEDPWHCVSDKVTDTVYVCSLSGKKITIVKWTQADGLRAVRELTAGSGLAQPSHMALDSRNKEYMYVACMNYILKVSLTTGRLEDMLNPSCIQFDSTEHRPESVAILGSIIMIIYDEAVMLCLEGSEHGRVIRSPDRHQLGGLCEDGVNFLVGDMVDRCIYVISLRGETLTTVNTGNIAPFNIDVDDDTVYVTAPDHDGLVHVLH